MAGRKRTHASSAGGAGTPGRFEGGFSLRTGGRDLAAALWDGLRLKCPACGSGPMFASKERMHPACPECGAPFERSSEGDFLGAIITAYGFIAALAIVLLLALNQFTELDLIVQLAIACGLSLVTLVVFYRNIRGVWVAILVALTKWLG